MKYTEVTLNEMTEFLNGFERSVQWKQVEGSAGTREYVFDYELPNFPGVVVRVYTSVHKATGIVRRKGADAIRICAVNLTKQLGWIRSTRVLRVEGWRDNLHRAIVRTISQATDRCEKIIRAQAAYKAARLAAEEAARNAPVEDIPFDVPA
jgi:hypothetical protein